MAASSGQQLEPDKASSASQKVDNPEISIVTTPQEAIGHNVYCPNRPTLKVTLLGDEWNSSAGGLSTINRELAIHFSKHPKVEVSLLVPEGACKDEEKRAAQSCGITVVDAKKRPAYDPLDWLSFPPPDLSMDIVVGHGVKLGRQGQVIRDSYRFHNCKWVQVVHTAPEDLSKYKSYADPISKGERKHQDEVDLCKLANLVVPVGPRLEEFYSSYLRCCKKDQDVFSITPGLFDREFGGLEQFPNENADFKVLIFGRGDDEDFELKGYNIAAEAFTDQRLKQKRYHLIFVGAFEGKQGEVRQKLLRCGIAEEQLTVRKFIQSRDRMKDLLCEVDLAIMPSKSEGFGLVALEALSAGLPILVGSKSGFAKALENVPFGKSCIVDSDDPTKWAEAIEAVGVRHGMRLEEIKALRASYEKKYNWKEQCEAFVEKMWLMVHGPSNGRLKTASVECSAEQQLPLEKGPQPEKRTFGTNEGASLSSTIIKHSYLNLSDEKLETVHEILRRQIEVYTKHHHVGTHDGVGGLIEHIKKTHHLALESVGISSLVIKVQCPTLESLESLWNDYCSGHLNKVAERCLVTDKIKKKLDLETVKLKTTIEEENYLTCKKALMEKSREAGSTDFSTEQTKPDQCTDSSSDFPKDELATAQKDEFTWMSRGPKMVNTYRVVLCGKAGVGKTSIFRRMCGSGLDGPGKKTATDHDECNVTIGVEGETIKLHLRDTAGLEKYGTLPRSHYLGSQAVMIVYSVTDQDSLNEAFHLLHYAKIHAFGAYLILVTNKIDLDPTVKEDDVLKLIPDNAFVLKFRTSALTGQGIQEMLSEMALHLFKKATPMKSKLVALV